MQRRKNVNLRNLPVWVQYTISVTVVVSVGITAWLVGQDQPVPGWIREYLIPALSGLFVILFIWLAINRIIEISNK